jgi:hypothetical protein
MASRIRTHIRSNVIGYVALFVALSGTAYAIDGPLPGQDQVGSADIINGEVQSADIKDANVTTADVRGNSVTSGKILDGEVLSADVRDDSAAGGGLNAQDLGPNSVGGSEVIDDSLGASDIDESTLTGILRCPSGMTRTADVCYGPEQSGAWKSAALFCAAQGLRLPTVGEALLVMADVPQGSSTLIWTTDSYVEPNIGKQATIATKNFETGQLDLQGLAATTAGPFRCVASPVP